MKKNVNIMDMVLGAVEWSCREYGNTLYEIFGRIGSGIVSDYGSGFSPEGVVKLKNKLHDNMNTVEEADLLTCLAGKALVQSYYYEYGWMGVSYLETSIAVDENTGLVYSHEHPSWETLMKRFLRYRMSFP